MTETLDKYSYLWDGSEPGWRLVKEADAPDEIFIVNREKGSLLHIDDPALKRALCEKMLDAGAVVEIDKEH